MTQPVALFDLLVIDSCKLLSFVVHSPRQFKCVNTFTHSYSTANSLKQTELLIQTHNTKHCKIIDKGRVNSTASHYEKATQKCLSRTNITEYCSRGKELFTVCTRSHKTMARLLQNLRFLIRKKKIPDTTVWQQVLFRKMGNNLEAACCQLAVSCSEQSFENNSHKMPF